MVRCQQQVFAAGVLRAYSAVTAVRTEMPRAFTFRALGAKRKRVQTSTTRIWALCLLPKTNRIQFVRFLALPRAAMRVEKSDACMVRRHPEF
jgi:hypothetical protein